MDEIKGSKDGTNISNLEYSKIETTRKKGKPKGLPKSGGRAKGTPNKASTKWSEVLESESFSIPVEAIRMFKETNTPANIKFQILQFLASYTTPAIKPTEKDDISQDDETNQVDILSAVSSN